MQLQLLYKVKERLEQAAFAGIGLLHEDFRLQRAAEALKPLAEASPVFEKISSGLDGLLSAPAEERSIRLLDLLGLVDAVVYTQGKTGLEGELVPLVPAGWTYHNISYGQLQPLIAALSSSFKGRMQVIRETWARHPEYFFDFRVLPLMIRDLENNSEEVHQQCAEILKQAGPAAVPLLKKGFDPAGRLAMARRVEVISAIQGAEAGPWLREVLPDAKTYVCPAVITALGEDPSSTDLLLDLAETEQGRKREAVLRALAKQSGQAVQTFWEEEVSKRGNSLAFLWESRADWAGDLVARSLRAFIGQMLRRNEPVPQVEYTRLDQWTQSTCGKASPDMLEFWRWADRSMGAIERLKNHTGAPLGLDELLRDRLLESLCTAGPGPLTELCLELWEKRLGEPRWLPHAVTASLMTRPAAEVYTAYSPYISTVSPLTNHKEELQRAVLRALGRVCRLKHSGQYVFAQCEFALAEPLDPRWIDLLTHAVCEPGVGKYYPFGAGDSVDEFDKALMDLVDPEDPDQRARIVPYLKRRLTKTGSWYSYSRYLLECGASPGGLVGEAMLGSGNTVSLPNLWNLLNAADRVLPKAETIALLQEMQGAERNITTAREREIFRTVFPYTLAELKKGRLAPDWRECLHMYTTQL